MKTVEFEFNDRTYHLCFNGAALFDCYDRFGTKGEITDNIMRQTRKGFENACWMLAKLSEQGEAVRKYLGLETQKPLTEAECLILLKPIDVLTAKEKIMEAIARGFMREETESEFDPWLAELEQKKTEISLEQNTSTQRHRFFGLRRKR